MLADGFDFAAAQENHLICQEAAGINVQKFSRTNKGDWLCWCALRRADRRAPSQQQGKERDSPKHSDASNSESGKITTDPTTFGAKRTAGCRHAGSTKPLRAYPPARRL